MTLSTHQDRFDKASAAYDATHAEVKRSYAIWCDACERLKRIEQERHDAFLELIDKKYSGGECAGTKES